MDSKLLLGIGAGVVLAVAGMSAAQHFSKPDETAQSVPATTQPAAPAAAQPAPATADAAPAGNPEAQSTGDQAPMETQRYVQHIDTPQDDGMVAQVRRVHPVIEQVTTPRKDCEQVTVTRRRPERDGNVGGTVLGAVIGGALGNQVGRGGGRKAATVAGAVAGGYVGHEIDARHENGKLYRTTETRCKTVDETADKVVAYEVTYVHNGREYTTRMDHDPGDTLIVEPTVRPVDTAR